MAPVASILNGTRRCAGASAPRRCVRDVRVPGYCARDTSARRRCARRARAPRFRVPLSAVQTPARCHPPQHAARGLRRLQPAPQQARDDGNAHERQNRRHRGRGDQHPPEQRQTRQLILEDERKQKQHREVSDPDAHSLLPAWRRQLGRTEPRVHAACAIDPAFAWSLRGAAKCSSLAITYACA